MYKNVFLILAFVLFGGISPTFAGPGKDSIANELFAKVKLIDSIEKAMKWEHNKVSISNAIKLNIPENFKFLNAEQSRYILEKLWGNPPQPDVLGIIFPKDGGPFADSSYAFVVTYEAIGYVKDDEANKIDYDEMLSNIKKGEAEENKERLLKGFGSIHFVGWAQKPFYDKERKVLHWAKEISFGNAEEGNTLNYDVRVLGRKGVLSLNAVAGMSELPLVKLHIDDILKIAEFTEGNRYQDFNSSTDKVAEYGIGALVAGGILAKTGVFAAIGKILLAGWKFILLGLAALGGTIRKIFGKKKEESSLS